MGRKNAHWRASGHPKMDTKSSPKASLGGLGALLGSLGRSFGTTGSQSTASGRILIAKREARRVPKGGRERPREAPEPPKSVFFGVFFDVYVEDDFSTFFYRFFVDFGMVLGWFLETKIDAQGDPRVRRQICKNSGFT